MEATDDVLKNCSTWGFPKTAFFASSNTGFESSWVIPLKNSHSCKAVLEAREARRGNLAMCNRSSKDGVSDPKIIDEYASPTEYGTAIPATDFT